ncbi:hypothetical protein LZ016_10180 [Sphingomonas sp. SM33]|uniref:Uncharacterized protein n=1 Tax=Sphingomonas telluris TaxID=2907998 RepID=A0ABS9VNB5_9SPHN|nr:hypothetical protein [Sphingomonas telluris]MCH8616465.1 hypothetical protein [Sphingomonas telluris]
MVVRVRERGREFTAEAHVIPVGEDGLLDHIREASANPRGIDPRLAELTIAPVQEFPKDIEKARRRAPA